MHSIAAGLRDEYAETGTIVGRLARCKKGDGLLACPAPRQSGPGDDGLPAHGWVDYLDEAERNRDAAASLGLVRTLEQNGGQRFACLARVGS